MSLPAEVVKKKDEVVGSLREHPRLLVALSGGVDSAALLAIAREALGAERVLAVTGRSESVTDEEIEDAARVAASLGVRHRVVATYEMRRPEYRANSGDRCLHCRTELFEILHEVAAEEGGARLAYGAILDDVGDHRPGMRAAEELGVLAPLLQARIGKTDIRALARHYDLHISSKPASACLASRIPAGTEVTPERLGQIARAERALRNLGFRQFRVRHHGEIARIELGIGEADPFGAPALRDAIVTQLKAVGFRFVVVDLEGYRAGSLNPEAPGTLYSILPQRDGGQ